MKHLFFLTIIACFTFPTGSVTAQEDSEKLFSEPDASPMDMAIYRDADDKILARVLYSRPQKKDRELFGELVPYGEVWRTGANESTELTLYQDMRIGDKVVKEGTYTLYTIPEENEWTVILNDETNTWGAYNYDETRDVARFEVPVKESPTTLESFSMTFESQDEGAELLMGWGDAYVAVPFEPVQN